MTDSRQERRSALESFEELTKIMEANVTKFEEEERLMRRKHSKQHKLQDSKKKSQSGHSTSSRNISEKSHKRSHHHLGSTIVPRKSNEKKPRPKPYPAESGATGKNVALQDKTQSAHLSGSSSSSSSSTKVGRPRYSSGHRYCMVNPEECTHTGNVQRRHHNRESQRSGTMRRSRYSGPSERRGRQFPRRRGFADQRIKSDCDQDIMNGKGGHHSREHDGGCCHGNDIDDDANYKIDLEGPGSKDCEDVCWSLPEHLLDDQSKNLYPFTNDGCHSEYPSDNSWSLRDHDEQLYADYYYNYNQCYSYYYAYNDCYFYQPRPEAHKPFYHPGHVVYDLVFEDKDSVGGDSGDIHMLYRKICQDVSHGNFPSVPGSVGFSYDLPGSHFFSSVFDNDGTNNDGSVELVEESSRRNELFPIQDSYAFPINKPDAVGNISEGNHHSTGHLPSDDYGKSKAFVPDISEYSQRHAISARAKQTTHNQKPETAECSPSVEDAEFERAFKRIMMEQFSLFTNFTPEFSEWCLDSCDWDYGKAAWNFIYDPRQVQKIPRDAYNV